MNSTGSREAKARVALDKAEKIIIENDKTKLNKTKSIFNYFCKFADSYLYEICLALALIYNS